MSEISAWILSIAGVICLSVVVELILPEGQMNKYIKSIFSFIIIFVIILPLPKLLGSKFDFSNIFEYSQIEIDDDYLAQVNLDKLNKLQSEIEEDITKQGYENVKVYINGNIFDNAMQISSIKVDLSNLVITENAEHKSIQKIKKHITSIICEHVKIGEEEVLYAE